MSQPIAQYLATLKLAEPVRHGRLAMYPLLAEKDFTPDYLILAEALAAGHCQVEEVSEGGRINRLLFVNRGHLPVLLLDGDVLVGARQNRVLDFTLLAPAKAKTELPVSCVEQGRWSYRGGRGFRASAQACYASLRALKAASRRGHGGESVQSAIWREISAKTTRLGAHSATQDMTSVYTTHEEVLEDLAAEFHPLPGQVGAGFTLDGSILGMDAFDSAATFAGCLTRLVRGYALESLDPLMRGEAAAEPRVETWLQRLSAARPNLQPAPGLGEHAHIDAPDLGASALVHADRVVHLFAYPKAGYWRSFDG